MRLRIGKVWRDAERIDLDTAVAMAQELSKCGIIVRALQPCSTYFGYELLIQRTPRTPHIMPLRGPALRLVVSNGVIGVAGTESDTDEFWYLGEAIRKTNLCCQGGIAETACWQLWQLIERGNPEWAKSINKWRPNRYAKSGSAPHLVRLKPRGRFSRMPEFGERVIVDSRGIDGVTTMELATESGEAYVRRDDLVAYLVDQNVVIGEDDGTAILRLVLRCVADYLQTWQSEPISAHALVGLRARTLDQADGLYLNLGDVAAWIGNCTVEPLPASIAVELDAAAASLTALTPRQG